MSIINLYTCRYNAIDLAQYNTTQESRLTYMVVEEIIVANLINYK